MTDLTNLIERARGLEGPDREVDAAIHEALVGPVIRFPLSGPWQANGISAVPAYTASLDAVVALIEKELPDALWDVNGYGAASIAPRWLAGKKHTLSETGTSPALALLLAFLTAMKEKGTAP